MQYLRKKKLVFNFFFCINHAKGLCYTVLIYIIYFELSVFNYNLFNSKRKLKVSSLNK